jgi:hypothetical protein
MTEQAKAWRDWLDSDEGNACRHLHAEGHYLENRLWYAFNAGFKAAETIGADRVRQSLELACKAVCEGCRLGLPLAPKWHKDERPWHTPNDGKNVIGCAAAPIRKLMDGGWDE